MPCKRAKMISTPKTVTFPIHNIHPPGHIILPQVQAASYTALSGLYSLGSLFRVYPAAFRLSASTNASNHIPLQSF